MLKGFKSKRQCIFAYYLFIAIIIVMVALFREVLLSYRFTYYHIVRIIMVGICCVGALSLDIEINRNLLNNTILVRGDINTYEECLKFYEKISLRKQHKYYFRLLQLLPLLEKEKYEIAKEELKYFTKDIELNVINQILLEFYTCMYYLKIGEKDKYDNITQLFYSKWKGKKFNKKTNQLINQCVDTLIFAENKTVNKEKSHGRAGGYKRIGFISVVIFLGILGIYIINNIENRKYHSVDDAYNVQHGITEKDFNELNAVYKKEWNNYYLLITQEKTKFSYYIFTKEKIQDNTYYYLKNSYSDEKAVIDQYHLPLIVYEQMRMSKVNIADNGNLFPAFGIVKEDDLEKVLVGNRKPDEIKKIVSYDKIYYVWFYDEIKDEEMESFIFEE